MSEHAGERRRFHRIATDKPVTLQAADGGEHQGKVRDISMRGLLFVCEDDWRPTQGARVSAQVRLDEDLCCIDMDGEVAHVEDRLVGIHCTALDLDSASLLRRMVELNLADDEQIERELSELIAG